MKSFIKQCIIFFNMNSTSKVTPRDGISNYCYPAPQNQLENKIRDQVNKNLYDAADLLMSGIEKDLIFSEELILDVAKKLSENLTSPKNAKAYLELVLVSTDTKYKSSLPQESQRTLEFISQALRILSEPHVLKERGETSSLETAKRLKDTSWIGQKIIESYPLHKLNSSKDFNIDSLIQNLRFMSKKLSMLDLYLSGQLHVLDLISTGGKNTRGRVCFTEDEIAHIFDVKDCPSLPTKWIPGTKGVFETYSETIRPKLLKESEWLIESALVLLEKSLPTKFYIKSSTVSEVLDAIPCYKISLDNTRCEMIYGVTTKALERYYPNGIQSPNHGLNSRHINRLLNYMTESGFTNYATKIKRKAARHNLDLETAREVYSKAI